MKSKSKMRRRFLKWLRTLRVMGPLISAACGANGNGASDINAPMGTPEESVTLVWKSDALASDRGQISGTLPNGMHYVGEYLEVMEGAEEERYASAWEGWQPYWSEWAWDGEVETMDWPGFLEIYRGTVIANLQSDDGKSRLRCRFIIDTPATGLAGGSEGLCQLSDGTTIDEVVLTPFDAGSPT